MVGGETLQITTYNGNTWSHFPNKHSDNLYRNQENTHLYETSLYSPDDALVVSVLIYYRFSECLFVKRDQVLPL